MRTNPVTGLLLAIAALPPITAQAQELQPQPRPSAQADQSGEVFAGVDYQQGDYGTGAKVETVSTMVGVAVRKGRVRLGAAVPYLRTTAPVDVVVSQGGLFGTPLLAGGGNQTVRTRREGLGDATLQAAYDMPVAGFAASVGGGLKLPTASRAKGLGTGKVDYAVNAQVARPLGHGITPFAAVGYTILSKPDDFAVRNTLAATAGTRVALSPGTSAALSYSYEQSASQALADRQSIGLGLGIALGHKLQLGLQGDAGLSRGAPDVKVGLRIGAGF
ncbi:MAG: transporter [Pseudomonadota bacterium]